MRERKGRGVLDAGEERPAPDLWPRAVHMTLPGALLVVPWPGCNYPTLCGSGACVEEETRNPDGTPGKSFSCNCSDSETPTVNLDGNVQCMPGTASEPRSRWLRPW